LAAGLALTSPATAAVQGKAWVLDGDTLEIGGQRWRLYGIKAPAPDQVCYRAGQQYACGKTARAMLWALIDGREVSCAPVAAAVRAGAPAAICTAGDTSLNLAMVVAGWALAEPADALPYGQLQHLAKALRRGLWTGEFEPPPARRQNDE
jgi:endonuclease YncB( thermonuclease family)